MPAPRILIISPRAEAVERLRAALDQAGFDRPPEVASEPPARESSGPLAPGSDPVRAVLVDLSGGAASFNALRQARRAFPGAVSVAASGPRRLSSVVQARQAGAWGYVTEPFDLGPLAERLGVQRPEPPIQPGALIAFVPAQGGNGASTVGMHVASAIAEKLGGRTLLVDFDLHTGTVAFQLGLAPRTSLADIFVKPQDVGSLDWKPDKWKHLHILVGPSDPQSIDPSSLADAAQVFEFMKLRYSAVIADLPPALGASSVRALEVADRCYIVCTPEVTSLHLARRKVDLLRSRSFDMSRLRLLINRMGTSHGLDTPQVERIVGAQVEWVLDNDYEAVRRAAWNGGLVASSTALAQQTQELGVEIVKGLKIEERNPRRELEVQPAAPATATGS